MTLALIGFISLFLLVFSGVPLALTLALVGFIGFAIIIGINPAGAMSAQIAWDTLSSYNLSVLPLFLLMGNLVNRAGISRELYDASNALIGHFRGGLAMATILACAGFSAVCGSSLATAATMSSIALPSMRRYGYSDTLSTGSIAAGGTLGILIPPSVIMVIYGSMTETSIGKLFIAGIVPGLIGVLLYSGAIAVVTAVTPAAGPAGPSLSWQQRLRALRGVWATLGLFIVVIGGIYLGIFTPTEAAGIGAAGAFVLALLRKTLTVGIFAEILAGTARMTAALLFVLVGALIFANFINVAGVPRAFVDMIQAMNMSPFSVLLMVMGFYLVLGCVFDSLAMILLTIPVFFPLVMELGFDPVWFGVLIVIVVEIGLISPPIGMNIFVMRSIATDIPIATIYKGVIPFILADIIRLALILLVPALVLFLPNQMIK